MTQNILTEFTAAGLVVVALSQFRKRPGFEAVVHYVDSYEPLTDYKLRAVADILDRYGYDITDYNDPCTGGTWLQCPKRPESL